MSRDASPLGHLIALGLILFGGFASGCGDDGTPATDTADAGDTAADTSGETLEDTAPVAPPLLGQSCSTGCLGTNFCANAEAACAEGYCLFDGREDWRGDSYCTMDCDRRACPAGYTCEEVGSGLAQACTADPAVCGDGIVQRGEGCDDGNRVDGDGCSADCREETGYPGYFVDMRFVVEGVHTAVGGEPTPFRIDHEVKGELEWTGISDCGDASFQFNGGNIGLIRVAACTEAFRADIRFEIPFVGTGTFDHDSPVTTSLRLRPGVNMTDRAEGCFDNSLPTFWGEDRAQVRVTVDAFEASPIFAEGEGEVIIEGRTPGCGFDERIDMEVVFTFEERTVYR